MPIDASIYSQIRQPEPQNQLAQYATMMQLQNAAQDRDLKMQEVDRANKLRDLLAGGADPYKAALQVGDLKNAGELAKAQAAADKDKREGEKIGLENSAKRLEIAGNAFKFVADNPTIENAHATLSYLGQHGILSPQQIDQYKASLPSDPAGLKNMASMAYNSAIAAKDKLFTFGQANTGGQTVELARNPVTGQVTTASTLTNTQSPDNAATVAATKRGQNLVDARARQQIEQGKTQYDPERGGIVNLTTGEFRPATTSGVPIGAKDKPLNDSQAKALGFGTRMQEADRILGELAGGGVNASVPGSMGNMTGAILNPLLSPDQQRLAQAKRDFMTAILRRESGAAITAGEFTAADKQYFPQVGDQPAVIAQKARNRALAIQGVMAEVPEKQRGSITPKSPTAQSSAKSIVRTGTLNGRKVVQYSDGTTDYAD